MFRNLSREVLIAIRLTLALAVVTGIVYPLAMTGIAQGVFNSQANGSLLTGRDGQVYGSSLIGQCFYRTTRDQQGNAVYQTTRDDQGNTIFAVDTRYFQSRPSFTVDSGGNPLPCNAQNSAGSNLAPGNAALVSRVKGYADYLASLGVTTPIPVDLVTGDFTGFDPDISEAGALAQVGMVAGARNLSPDRVRTLVENHVDGRVLGIFGEPHVNVLALNRDLDDGAAG